MSNRKGFTIVELLTIIIVIGILTTVGIVSYNGFQTRAKTAAVTAALIQANKKLTIYEGNNNAYPAVGNLSSVDIVDSKDVSYQYSLTSSGYCMTATAGTVSYKITEAGLPAQGGCAGHGVGGASPITNYARDPNASASTTAFGAAGGGPAVSTRSIATDQKHSGTSALKVAITGSGQTGASARVPTNSLRVNVGEKVSWSVWVYSTKAGSLALWADGAKVSDGTYAGMGGATTSVPVNTWTKLSGTYSPTVDMYVSQAGVYNMSVVAGDTLWFDEFMITKTSSVQNYADGSTSNWVWNGTPNDSSSTGPAV